MPPFSSSRRAFLQSSPAAAALGLSAGTAAAARNVPFTMRVVGPGTQFPDVASAMDSITDASRTRPYVIEVQPGVYDLSWSAKPFVTVRGWGPLATIFEGRDWDSLQIAASNVHLADFGVRFTGSDERHAAIRRDGFASPVYLENLHIEQRGPGSAIRTTRGDTRSTWWLSRIKINAQATAIYAGCHLLIDDTKIALAGDHTGTAHIGVRVALSNSRLYLSNCRIGTGYWYESAGGGPLPQVVSGDDDVVAIWLQPGCGNTRVEVHSLESFCRNETTQDPSVNVNVLRIEDGWLRAFGCFGQSETPANWRLKQTVYQREPGKLELFASRFSQIRGSSSGADNLGVDSFGVADDGYELDKFESGLHLLDATRGDFTLRLRKASSTIPLGEQHLFKKINPENVVTIDLNGATLDGSAIPPRLTAENQLLRIAWSGSRWERL